MSGIHKMSSVVPLHEYYLHAVPPTKTTVIYDVCSEHRPSSNLSSKGFIQFNINTGQDEYIRLNEIMLHLILKLKIDKPLKAKVLNDD